MRAALFFWAALASQTEDCEPSQPSPPSPPSPPSLQLLQQSLHLGRGPVRARSEDSLPASLAGGLAKLLDGCSGWDCLKRYVDQPDANYGWRDSSVRLRGAARGVAWTAALLQMTSQEWLADEVSPSVWNHSLVVISPGNIAHHSWCLLYIAMGFYGSSGATGAVAASDPDVEAAAEIAVAAGMPAAVLFNVPAEMLTFKHSEFRTPLVEDGTLSYTWALFTRQPFGPWRPEPRLLLELPMTKAVVRALDTISAFAGATLPGLSRPQKFALLGTSKRGHLCWHGASVDPRVQAIIPVAKALNMPDFLDLTKKELGGLPQAVSAYSKTGMLGNIADSLQGQWFVNITDAYAYKQRFAGLPKLAINAANDEFFVPDHTRVWWPAMPDPKWHLMVPNSGHIVGGRQIQALADPISAFLDGVVLRQDSYKAALPQLSWKIRKTGTLTATLNKASPAPSEVLFWQATTCNSQRRDFRLHNADSGEACRLCGHVEYPGCVNQAVAWNKSSMQEVEHRSFTWQASVTPPADGRWTAFFFTFHWPNGLQLSTEVSVMPVTLPFPDCPPRCDMGSV